MSRRSCWFGLIVEIRQGRLRLVQDANLALPVPVRHLNRPSKHRRHTRDTRILQIVVVRHVIAQHLLAPFLCTVSYTLPPLPAAAAADGEDFAAVVVAVARAVVVVAAVVTTAAAVVVAAAA